MLQNLFERQQQYLNHFFENVDLKKAEAILKLLLECKGNIILTGVGKSGHIANKLATTMLSTGTKAFYISPVDALHGDMGILSEDDIFLIFSKSGSTKELIDLVPYVRAKKVKIISVSSNANSRLDKFADISIFLPVQKEICPFNLAPTTSAAVQLLFGDILTVALMKSKNFSLTEYAKNHPSGSIGKKITVRVEDLMIKGEDIPSAYVGDRVIDIIDILSKKRCGAIVIVSRDSEIRGIFTDGDLRRAIERYREGFLKKRVEEVMTESPRVIEEGMLAWDALKEMEMDKESLITVLPVVRMGKVVGIIRLHDIIQEGIG